MKDKSFKIQTYYNRNHTDIGTTFSEHSSVTDQSFKMDTDINYLLAHMAGQNKTPLFGIQDTSTFEDWSNEMAMVKRRFMDLDEEARNKFVNTQNFLKWCSDPNNYEGELPSSLKKKYQAHCIEHETKTQDDIETRMAKKIAEAMKG